MSIEFYLITICLTETLMAWIVGVEW